LQASLKYMGRQKNARSCPLTVAGALPTNQRPLRLTSHPLMVFPGVNEQMKTHPLTHILRGMVRLCRYIVPTVNTRVNPASAVISIHTGKKCVPVNEYRTRSVK